MVTEYKFNGKPACHCKGYEAAGREKDEETGMYYYGARYYIPELSIWGSVDPLSDKYPSMSPFMYCAGNPVILVNPDGMDIDPTAPGYKAAKENATPSHPNYQPAFADLWNKWEKDETISVQFNNNMSKSKHPNEGGTVEPGGSLCNEIKGIEQDIYKVFWDPSITDKLGTSGLFEEAKHFDDFLEGIVKSIDSYTILDEVRAKSWVVKNILGITTSYRDRGDGSQRPSHFGYFLNNPDKLTPQSLGIGLTVYFNHPSGMLKGNLYGTGGDSYTNLYRSYLLKQASIFFPNLKLK